MRSSRGIPAIAARCAVLPAFLSFPLLAQQTQPAVAEDIRDLKPPVDIPSGYAWIGWVLTALAIAVAAWWIWNKWRAKKSAPLPQISIPPHRKAKDRLRIANELLSDPYRFCSLVSDVVRIYLEERFDLHAPDRTTEEFLAELRSSSKLNPQHQELLEAFLTQCDLVKFARHEPTVDELRALLDSALRLIDETALLGTGPEPQLPAKAA